MCAVTRCTARSLLTNKEIGYTPITESILAFNPVGCVHMDVRILHGGQGLAQSLISHRHASFCSRGNNEKVEDAGKGLL